MRQDIQLRNYAENLGFSIDPVQNVGESYKFRKGDFTIWQCVRMGKLHWATAQLINNHYRNHNYFISLKDALDSI